MTLFDAPCGERIAAWVRTEQELTWLAPGTAPPLTPEKVVAWGRDRGRRFLFWIGPGDGPAGYAELNYMPVRSSQMWIGHFIVDPERRGCSVGFHFAAILLASAFLECSATDVALVVFPDNRAAIRCYERVGFLVTGQETKFFDATQQEHGFVRMSIDAARFHRLVAAGQLPGRPPAREPRCPHID